MKHQVLSILIVLLISASVLAQKPTRHIDSTMIGVKEATVFVYDKDNPEMIKKTHKTEYNEHGEKLAYYELDKEREAFILKNKYEYEDGLLVSIDRYIFDGKRIAKSSKYEYNEKGQLIRSKLVAPAEEKSYAYDDQGRVTMIVTQKMIDRDTMIYVYDDEKNTRLTQHIKDGEEKYDGILAYYDEKGRIIKEDKKTFRDEPCSRYYSYEDNRLVSFDSCYMNKVERKYNDEGQEIYYKMINIKQNNSTERWYNDHGDVTKMIWVIQGEVQNEEIHEYEYDENDNPLKHIVYKVEDGEKVLYKKITTGYDENGKSISYEFYNYRDGKASLVKKRRRELVYH